MKWFKKNKLVEVKQEVEPPGLFESAFCTIGRVIDLVITTIADFLMNINIFQIGYYAPFSRTLAIRLWIFQRNYMGMW